jgi:hypothetical protein
MQSTPSDLNARKLESPASLLAERGPGHRMAASNACSRATHMSRRGPMTEGTADMKPALFATALALALSSVTFPAPAEAKGCLKGALVGGVAGHYAGRHALLGAIGGCLVGRHLANEKEKEKAAAAAQSEHPAPAPNGY